MNERWSFQRARVVFGAGARGAIGEELDSLEFARALVVTTPGRTRLLDEFRDRLGERFAGASQQAAQHVPVDRVDAALLDVARARPDILVAVGGGSAIGLAKAIAREREIAIAAIPTTYAGSEMTDIWGLSAAGVKQTGRDSRVAARLVIYDPELTLTLPPHVSAASGMNAVAHAVEALYAPDADPRAAEAAEDALRLLSHALPLVAKNPNDLDARTAAMRGAHRAGVALQLAPMGLHHKLCHVLGGLGLPHAETHAALLPHVVAFDASAAPEATARIARALGSRDATEALRNLNERMGLSMSLKELGLRADAIPGIAASVAAPEHLKPRPATTHDIERLLRAGF